MMIKKKPVVKKKVVKAVVAKKNEVKPNLTARRAAQKEWLLNNLPENVEMVRDVSCGFPSPRVFTMLFAKGKTLRINDIKPHVFQAYEKTFERKICSMGYITIPLEGADPEDAYWASNWAENINLPQFSATGIPDALEILERF